MTLIEWLMTENRKATAAMAPPGVGRPLTDDELAAACSFSIYCDCLTQAIDLGKSDAEVVEYARKRYGSPASMASSSRWGRSEAVALERLLARAHMELDVHADRAPRHVCVFHARHCLYCGKTAAPAG